MYFLKFWLQLEAYQLHIILFKEQEPCHPQLVMEPICKWKNSCMSWVAVPAPAIGVKWPNNCLHQSTRQLWCISLTVSPAPTDTKKQMIAKKMERKRKEHIFQDVISSFIKPKLSIWPIIFFSKINFPLKFQINGYFVHF